MGGSQAGEGFDFSEEILDHVLPMAEHIDDDSAVVFLTVVPGGALEFLEFSGKHPVSELSPDGENLSEEASVDEVTKFEESWQPQFVLHYAVFQSGGSDFLREGQGFLGGGGGRLFAIDVFLGGDRLAHTHRALAGEGGIKVDLVGGIFESGVEIRGDAGDAVRCTESAELFLASADEDGIGHNHLARLDLHSALFADGDDGADEVLVGAHASGDAVHDDSDFMFFHIFLWVEFEGSGFFCALGLGAGRKGRNIDACFRKGAFQFLFPVRDIAGRTIDVDHSHGLVSGIGQLVKNFGGNEDRLACSDSFAFFAETHFPFAFDDEVNFFLFLIVPRDLATFGLEGDVAHGKVFGLHGRESPHEVLGSTASWIGAALNFAEIGNRHSFSPKKVRYGFPPARRSR